MTKIALGLALAVLATPALAQAPATPSSPPTSQGSSGSSNQAADRPGESHSGHGPAIKVRGPGGSEVSVYCASGDTTRACADIVTSLVDRLAAAGRDRRDDRDDRDDYRRWRDR